MQSKLIATIALLLLILSLSASGCSKLLPKQSYKWHVTLEIDPSISNRESLVGKTVTVLQERLNRIGLTNAKVDIAGAPENGRVRIDLPDVKDPERLKSFISSQGLLQLVHVVSDPSPAPVKTYSTKDEAHAAVAGNNDQSVRVLPYPQFEAPGEAAKSVVWVIAQFPPIIDGNHLRSARPVPGERVGLEDNYEVHFTLAATAAAKFGIWTAANINEYLGVVLNNEVKSIAFIKSQIFDSAMISGNFTKQSAEDLAHLLSSGPLPASVRIIEDGNN
jgi:preprotein translocase subunit SecD